MELRLSKTEDSRATHVKHKVRDAAISEPYIIIIIGLLTTVVFLFDILTPHDDVSISFLYTIPILVTIFGRSNSPYPFVALTTLLSVIGAFIQTPRETLDLVFFANRGIAIGSQWLVAFLVAARKRTEALMRTDFEVERQKVETGRRFMDVLSHEIGTSLTMIDGQAYRLKKLSESNEPLDEISRADKIRKAVRRIETVVRQVQLASEVGEGAVYYRPTALSLVHLLNDVIVEFSSARQVDADLAALPPAIRGDADMLRQAVVNVLSNAIKYSPADTPISIVGWTDRNEAVLSIADRGRGIPDDEKSRLSEPYFRARNSHGVHGTGIGLYVARRFIAIHAGAIDITSMLGVGTTVTFRLPIGPPTENSDAPAHFVH